MPKGQKLETSQKPNNQRLNRPVVEWSHGGILFSHRNEQTVGAHGNMGGPRTHEVER